MYIYIIAQLFKVFCDSMSVKINVIEDTSEEI